ncbi:MAG: pyrroline-5-carboxylate reductase [Beijerinckiaceae bacterium]|jgi:pyrroline-5-carboxylate reductase|nr:pyrroline-5-carboxylate reductase [Beijerinckiaceae bacterium]
MTNTALPNSLVLMGAGKMGGAMLEGWLGGGLPGAALTVLDPNADAALEALALRHGFRLNPPLASIAAPQVLVLGIKPQMLDAAAPAMAGLAGSGTLVISILAGKTIANLEARMPAARAFVRAMPNLPASVQRGVTGVAASTAVTPAQRAMTTALLSGIGQVEWVPGEDFIDAVTAVSGSGPAYVFLLVECLTEAGIAAGLPADVAARLARGTVEGAGELLHRSPLEPATLRQNVTSPGGTTAAALDVLMAENGLKPLMRRAVAAARQRAAELSG